MSGSVCRKLNQFDEFRRRKLTWPQWLAELDAHAKKIDHPYGPDGPLGCGEECWRANFDAGDTPEEAIAADSQHWEE